jgi:hypothetical protein
VFIGHHAADFAAKRFAPRVSLGTLQIAAVFPDLLVFVFLIVGIEHIRITPGITAFSWLDAENIAISHSLAMDVTWSALFGGAYFLHRRDARGAWVIGALVLSHWVFDFVSHRPDMPLAPGLDSRLGLGLWYSLPATFVVEGALWIGSLAIYIRTTTPKRRWGTIALCVLVGLLTIAFFTMPFRPAPPSVMRAVLMAGVPLSLVLALSFGVDRLRAIRVSDRRLVVTSSTA